MIPRLNKFIPHLIGVQIYLTGVFLNLSTIQIIYKFK